MALRLRYSAVSDIGRSRRKNDDSGYAGPHFLMIADGMGGAAAGDLASAIAVQTMRRLDAPIEGDLLEALAGAVHRANDRLAELIEEDPAVEGMGTTVDAMLFDGTQIGLAHLGDSRGYLWRGGSLTLITHDHTWVQSLIDDGRITEDEAKVHSHRSLLLKVLDGRHDNDPDLSVHRVEAGDRILLCSDGLSGFVDASQIEQALGVGTCESAAEELLQLALDAASTDNITVVVADIVDDDDTTALYLEPIIVGSAADHPRGAWSRLRSWAHRDQLDPDEHLVDPDIDPEELRYAPREPRRYRWLKRGVIAAVVLAILGVVGKWSYDWTQTQYFVSADGEYVAIYRGVQADLPGISLHHVYERQDLLLSELPSYRRSQAVEGIDADDLSDARSIVAKLQGFADACASQATSPTTTTTSHPPASSTTPRDNQTGKPGSGGTPSQGGGKPGAGGKPSHGSTAKPGPTTSPTTPVGTTTPPTHKPRSPGECSGAVSTTGGTP
ncbi:MAG TPA: protein phosphatase 2C domain-containing protein [Nocardioidaceae bacterium]|nr:protein phosphatase 2C domain-containing protein [Nocardioidaceae bacterium]